MNKQILLCVETNKQSRTDYVYIDATIKRFYKNDYKITYRPIFLESKTKYNAKDKLKEINARRRKWSGETQVIYFIDTDNSDVSYDMKKLNDDIREFCQTQGFDLVFFTKDIEDVYWGIQVNDTEKVKFAEKFNRNKRIEHINESNLTVNNERRHCSNILLVLDKYWVRKDN